MTGGLTFSSLDDIASYGLNIPSFQVNHPPSQLKLTLKLINIALPPYRLHILPYLRQYTAMRAIFWEGYFLNWLYGGMIVKEIKNIPKLILSMIHTWILNHSKEWTLFVTNHYFRARARYAHWHVILSNLRSWFHTSVLFGLSQVIRDLAISEVVSWVSLPFVILFVWVFIHSVRLFAAGSDLTLVGCATILEILDLFYQIHFLFTIIQNLYFLHIFILKKCLILLNFHLFQMTNPTNPHINSNTIMKPSLIDHIHEYIARWQQEKCVSFFVILIKSHLNHKLSLQKLNHEIVITVNVCATYQTDNEVCLLLLVCIWWWFFFFQFNTAFIELLFLRDIPDETCVIEPIKLQTLN